MFKIVDASESKKYQTKCSNILFRACSILNEKGITAQFSLVGSGARNMVTRNGKGPFDLDYNLEIIKALEEYWDDLQHLKDTVRTSLNEAMQSVHFSDWKDSTSCLTAIWHSKDKRSVEFSLDVAIITRGSDNTAHRLIHVKNAQGYGKDQYVWNKVPDSRNITQKAKQIKDKHLWFEVRDRYVDLKNMYLSQNDKNHPSFVVYIQAVNDVYNAYFGYRSSMPRACIIHF